MSTVGQKRQLDQVIILSDSEDEIETPASSSSTPPYGASSGKKRVFQVDLTGDDSDTESTLTPAVTELSPINTQTNRHTGSLTRFVSDNPSLHSEVDDVIADKLMDNQGLPLRKARNLAPFVRFVARLQPADRGLAEELHSFLDREFENATKRQTRLSAAASTTVDIPEKNNLHRKAGDYLHLRSHILQRRDELRKGDVRDIIDYDRSTRALISGIRQNMANRDSAAAMNIRHQERLNIDRQTVLNDENYIRSLREAAARPPLPPYQTNISVSQNQAQMSATHLGNSIYGNQPSVNVPTYQDPPSYTVNPYDSRDVDHLVDQLRTPVAPVDLPPQLNVDLHEHQRLGLGWLLRAEKSKNKGGILSDDMGLGKTVQTIALMYANPPPLAPRLLSSANPDVSSDSVPETRNGADPLVLIICPVAVLEHWREELQRRVKPEHRLRVYIHHRGVSKTILTSAQMRKDCDVVIASYAGVANEFRSKKSRSGPHPLFNLFWYRIVLDEAHLIRNPNTLTSLSCAALNSDYRLCLTGTPMQNKPGDLYALVRFLRIAPWWNDPRGFNQMIQRRPILAHNIFGDEGSDSEDDEIDLNDTRSMTLVALLAAISLRRTKNTMINGRKILEGLPDKSEDDRVIAMVGEELEEYQALANKVRSRAQALQNSARGIEVWGKALVLLLRLRQQACHPKLIDYTSMPQESEMSAEEVAKAIKRAKRMHPDTRRMVIFDSAQDGVRRFRDESAALIPCDQCSNFCEAASTTMALDICGHLICSECYDQIEEDTSSSVCQKPGCFSEFHHAIPFEAIELLVDNPHMSEEELVRTVRSRDKKRREDRVRASADRRHRLEQVTRNSRHGSSQQSNGFTRLALDLNSDDFAPPSDDNISFSTKKSEDLDEPLKTDSETPAGESSESSDFFRKHEIADGADPLEQIIDIDEVARLSVCHKVFEDGWQSSAKIETVLNILREIWTADRTIKVIIFSSFTSLLDVLTIPLISACVGHTLYTGKLSAGSRQEVLTKFRNEADCRVMLTSIKAGNVGLTLTEASRVIIVDPYWNPYVEEQAKDRVYRIGQTKPVTVYRTLMASTVEDKIVEIQNKKRSLIEGAQDPQAQSKIRALTQQELLYTLGVGTNPAAQPVAAPSVPGIPAPVNQLAQSTTPTLSPAP